MKNFFICFLFIVNTSIMLSQNKQTKSSESYNHTMTFESKKTESVRKLLIDELGNDSIEAKNEYIWKQIDLSQNKDDNIFIKLNLGKITFEYKNKKGDQKKNIVKKLNNIEKKINNLLE